MPKDPRYKPFEDGIGMMSPMSPPPIASPYNTPYPSVSGMLHVYVTMAAAQYQLLLLF